MKEAQRNWTQIENEDYGFDTRDRKINAYRRATVESVKSTFREIFFDNPRRLNVKVYSQNEFKNDRSELIAKNAKFYEMLGTEVVEIKDMKTF